MVNLILDTTYVLPLFGFEVNGKNITEQRILTLWKEGILDYQIYLPSICLMEVLFRVNAEFRKVQNEDILKRYNITLPTILNSKKIQVFSCLTDLKVSEYALKIRTLGHSDLMDCLIAATAYSLEGILLSEDGDLKKIIENGITRKLEIMPLDTFFKRYQK